MTITLPPALDRIVRDKVKTGLYASETELVCEALRREFARDAVHEWVRAQAADGFAQLDAGEFEDITREELTGRLAQRRAAGHAPEILQARPRRHHSHPRLHRR